MSRLSRRHHPPLPILHLSRHDFVLTCKLLFSFEISAVTTVTPTDLVVVATEVIVTEPVETGPAAPLLLPPPEAVARAGPGLVSPRSAETGYRIPRSTPAPSAKASTGLPVRETQRIRRQQAQATERRQLRAESRPKRSKFSCRVCSISCNSRVALADHKTGRRHLYRVATRGKTFKCVICDREFDNQGRLDRHLRGKYHLREVLNQ